MKNKTKQNRSLIAFGCHNDDIELRAGGTILTMTEEGTRAMYVLQSTVDSPEAASILRCDYHSLNYSGFHSEKNNSPFSPEGMKSFQDDIEQIIIERNADLVMTHCIDDHHPDHYMMSRCVYLAVMELIKQEQFDGELWFWEFGGCYGNSLFQPNIGIDITDVMEKKETALKCHVKQIERAPVLLQSIYTRGKRWGSYFGYELAEAFLRVTPEEIMLREQAHLDDTEWKDLHSEL